jgi:hypothetical protein
VQQYPNAVGTGACQLHRFAAESAFSSFIALAAIAGSSPNNAAGLANISD